MEKNNNNKMHDQAKHAGKLQNAEPFGVEVALFVFECVKGTKHTAHIEW